MPDSAPEPWESLYRYWLSKHVGGRPPGRREIDPVIDIPQLVANLLIIEAGPDGYHYRLAGSEVVAHEGRDMTGLSAGYQSKRYGHLVDEWLETLDFVREAQTPRLIFAHFPQEMSAKNIVLLLPLHAAPGEPEKILVGSFYRGHFEPGTKVEGLSVLEVSLRPQ